MGVGFLRAPAVAPAPFDVPCPGPEIPGGFVGVRHADGALTSELALIPGPAAPHRLDEPAPGAGALLRIESLTGWLARPEAAAVQAMVRLHPGTAPGRGAAAAAYRALLGPLSPVPDRRVHLQIVCRPLAHPALIARYGAGPAAALRYSVSAVRRLAALLRADGIGVRALRAAELSTGPPGRVVATIPAAGPIPAGPIPAEPVPLSGSGPVLGADERGRPAVLSLAGPGIAEAAVVGDDAVVRRVVARLAGIGLGAAVFTDRPRFWAGLIDAVADPALLHPAAAGPAPVLIDDLPDRPLGRLDGRTVLTIGERGPGAAAGIPMLRQDTRDPRRAVLSGGGRVLAVRLVGTPAEDALIGP